MSIYQLNKIELPQDYLTLFKIEPSYISGEISNNKSFASYISSVEHLLEDILSESYFSDALENPTPENLKRTFANLRHHLPIISFQNLNPGKESFSYVVLCDGEHTHGVGRFIGDMLCKWLIPGRQLALTGNRSLNFHFANLKERCFFLCEHFIVISDEKEYQLIKNNIDSFSKQLRLNILAVYHARHVLSVKKLSLEEKSALIQENISSLLENERIDVEKNAFDQMQNFLIKLSAEKNLSQIKDNLNRLMNKRPKSFDRDIYETINYVRISFDDHFTALRDPRYVSRLIGYFYLFNKIVKQKLFQFPETRHLSIKLLKTHHTDPTNQKNIIGIMMTMNLLQETERFDLKHLIQAIKNCIQESRYVKNSFISDKRDEKILSYYLEIEKQNNTKFSLEEIKNLNKNLPAQIKTRVENVINPIFMPRNEEEILRNIILLSKQIKYVKDIPQLIIIYDKQTGKEISFIVILVRLIKGDTPPIKEFFSYSQTFLKYIPEEEKIIGSLKKKYPKEVNIFRLSLNKSPFYRRDYSLDLQKARQVVVTELAKIIGDFRDYNGGMIHKQTQALDRLKQELPTLGKDKDFFIENFFYSIKPGIMQSILDTNTLKTFFLLFLQVLEQGFGNNHFTLKTLSTPKYLLLMIGATSPSCKERVESVIDKQQIQSFDLTSCFMQEDGICALGYIYRTNNLSKHTHFYHTVLNEMNRWNKERNEK
jgi:hypothetical protein